MARYAAVHPLELTEEVVPLDDPPASDRPYAAEAPRSQPTTSEPENLGGRSDARWVIEPDAGADFNELAEDELDAPAREPARVDAARSALGYRGGRRCRGRGVDRCRGAPRGGHDPPVGLHWAQAPIASRSCSHASRVDSAMGPGGWPARGVAGGLGGGRAQWPRWRRSRSASSGADTQSGAAAAGPHSDPAAGQAAGA
jgi:hypothetical protein